MMGTMSKIALALRLGALVALLPLAACFTYVDATLESASPGTQARLRLDDDAFNRVVNQAAMNGFPVESLDMNRKGFVGRIVEVGADDLSVRMRGIGTSMFTANVQTNAIQSIAFRSFSPKRTMGAIAMGFVLARTFSSGFIGGTVSQQPDPGEQNFVQIPYVSVPIVSIPFP